MQITQNRSLKQVVDHLLPAITEKLESIRRVFKISITGDGNTGKSSLVVEISRRLEGGTVSFIEIDRYAIPRQLRRSKGMSGYNPGAFDVKGCSEAIRMLAEGTAVWAPYYDHATGISCCNTKCRKHPHLIKAAKTIIATGIFMWDLRHFPDWDLCVYLRNIDKAIRSNRISRDVETRGYSLKYASEHFSLAEFDKKRFIDPSMMYADFLIEVSCDQKFSLLRHIR